MWKVTGRSSALDRAQALLCAKRSSRGGDPPTATQGGSFKSPSDHPNIQTLMSDLSELSMESSASSAEAARNTQEDPERKGGPTKDLRPQSSLGEGSRFLKKAPKPATSSQSPVSRNQSQPVVESRRASSQAPAWRRLAEIESRVRNRQQELQQAKRATQAAAVQNTEASVEPSEDSDSEQSRKGKRFLKKTSAATAEGTDAAPPAGVGDRSRSGGGSAEIRSGGLEKKQRREGSAINLESDEEDIKELLGDSFHRLSSGGSPQVTLSHPDRRVGSSAAAGPPSSSNTAPPRSPASPSHRRSPFRFTGQAQVQFSPSALSPSPPPPDLPTSHPERPGSSQRPGSRQSSHSSSAEVLSLEELFPVGPDSDHQHSILSSVSSEDFRINVRTLDELIPASTGAATEELEKQLVDPVPGSHEEEEVVPDYQSDFDSSVGQISEHLGDDDDDEKEEAEVREEVSTTEKSHSNPDDDCSSASFEPSRSSVSWTRSRRSSSQRSTRRSYTDAAVQTHPDPTGVAPVDPTVSRMYLKPIPAVSAERLEAISLFNPAGFALNETLKQQLAMTRRFMERSDELHAALLRSLEPPNYRYTTLEETIHVRLTLSWGFFCSSTVQPF
ncbi:uncharacterized protein C19orf44 homolog isoform X2 [Cyprinodon tularosa]|uniref:uncharacterized protein C19orf44 homolog isoform X2 n=1 Tax=Cyprinodon tularosa TaxID=77115 RepID=UPI0018E25DC9|nr:uncharacterized protein C19orf44 homolog isoform X2 [Cyprinodon tularosa]